MSTLRISPLQNLDAALADKRRPMDVALVDGYQEMTDAELGEALLTSQKFRRDLLHAKCDQQIGELETAQSRMAENIIRISGKLDVVTKERDALEETRKDQAVIIRNERASKRRQLLWCIAFTVGGMAVAFVAGVVVAGWL